MGELTHGATQILVFKVCVLTWRRTKPCGALARGVLNFMMALAAMTQKRISQDCEQPSREVRTRLKSVSRCPRPQERFLDEIVGEIVVPAEALSIVAQLCHLSDKLI